MTDQVTLEHCGRTIAASVVAFDLKWAGDLPAGREVTWAVRVVSGDGESQVELGHRRSAGRTSQYALDLASGRSQEVGVDADLQADEITVRFPSDVVGVAADWPTWKAVIEIDGCDVTSLAVPA